MTRQRGSQTWQFEQVGWTGVLGEPQPDLAESGIRCVAQPADVVAGERGWPRFWPLRRVDYSRMMHDDEPGMLALLQKHPSEVIDPGIVKHHGRVIKLMGDGLLAER